MSDELSENMEEPSEPDISLPTQQSDEEKSAISEETETSDVEETVDDRTNLALGMKYRCV